MSNFYNTHFTTRVLPMWIVFGGYFLLIASIIFHWVLVMGCVFTMFMFYVLIFQPYCKRKHTQFCIKHKIYNVWGEIPEMEILTDITDERLQSLITLYTDERSKYDHLRNDILNDSQ